jgi:hypothetical protein
MMAKTRPEKPALHPLLEPLAQWRKLNVDWSVVIVVIMWENRVDQDIIIALPGRR